MDFVTQQDIAAPIDAVWQAVTDFPAFERQILRRGAELRRLDVPPNPVKGASWHVAFQYRGRDRNLELTITQAEAPNHLALSGHGASIDFSGTVELLALSRQQTRLTVTLGVAPKTLSARLLLQSLRLARGRLQRRYDTRVEIFARDVEQRLSRTAPAPR